jgi:alpha-L-glutamate ligase-like protein/uncharacterized protein (TIGR02421 family)
MLFKKHGILGINARDLLYLRPFNKEKAIQIADSKLKTKTFLSTRGIPVPKLYAVIKKISDFEKIKFERYNHGFAIKPNNGSKGKGIIIIEKQVGDNFYSPTGDIYSKSDLKQHIFEIINGTYSLNNAIKDQAFIEQYIQTIDELKVFFDYGLPDIRVIVHNLVPVMAMIRIPTNKSKGKGNLHQGAIGAGIDIAKGVVTTAYYNNRMIREIPGRGPIIGFKIPFWDEILKISTNAQLATNLGYLAADIAIDRHAGPTLLEINARAGIGIQLANQKPLLKRLERIEDLEIKSIDKGIRIGKDLFGYSIEKNIKTLSGKKVIGLYETIDVFNNKLKYPAIAFINTGKKNNLMSLNFAYKIGLIKSKKVKIDDLPEINTKIRIGEIKLLTTFKIDRIKKKKYQIVLGKNSIINNFLIDPNIKRIAENSQPKNSINTIFKNFDPVETDQQICTIESQLPLLKYIRPLNYLEERSKFLRNHEYNPQLIYPELKFDPAEFQGKLRKIKYNDSPVGRLFKDKIDELQLTLSAIESRGLDIFSEYSKLLFGAPKFEELEDLSKREKIIKENTNVNNKIKKLYTAEEVKTIFEDVIASYGLIHWKVLIQRKVLARCMINKNKKIVINGRFLFTEQRIKKLITHEIETHLLTAENGLHQKYKLFNRGFTNYLETQEGLAMYNVIKQNQRYMDLTLTMVSEAIYYAEKYSFAELFQYLKNRGMQEKSAVNMSFRVKRGLSDTSQPGAMSKDYCYYKGLKSIENFVSGGGNIKDLYYGKYNLKDLETIKSLINPEYQPILPKWLIL